MNELEMRREIKRSMIGSKEYRELAVSVIDEFAKSNERKKKAYLMYLCYGVPEASLRWKVRRFINDETTKAILERFESRRTDFIKFLKENNKYYLLKYN